MNIAFIGNYAQKKGSEVFKDLVLANERSHNWHIFGYVGDIGSYHAIRHVVKRAQAYETGQLKPLLQSEKIDVCLLLSIWPETFSKTFFELLSYDMPFISFDLGYPKTTFPKYRYFVKYSGKPKDIELLSRAINTINIEKAKQAIAGHYNVYKKDYDLKRMVKYSVIDNNLKA